MEEWDAQKMLDSYIHDYMIRKNMHQAAETFAEEANVDCNKPLALNPPEGFLTEWWSLFWDVYCARPESNSNAIEGSSSMAAEDVPQNVHLNMPMPESTMNFMLPNVGPTAASSGPSTVVPIIRDTTVLTPTIDSFSHNDAPTIRPIQEMNLNSSGKVPISDSNFRKGKSVTDFPAARTRDHERLKLPAREVSSSSRLFDVDQLVHMLPAIGTSSNPPNKVNNHLLPSVGREDENGSGVRLMDAKPTDGQNALQIMRTPTNTAPNSPEGFLTDRWSLFSDVYPARLENTSNATEGFSSMAAENVTQDVHPDMAMPELDSNFMLPIPGPAVAKPRPGP